MDTLGLLLVVMVFAADLADADGAATLLAGVADRFPRLRQLWADGTFLGWFVTWCQQVVHWRSAHRLCDLVPAAPPPVQPHRDST